MTTAKRWADRYRAEGDAGIGDRSSGGWRTEGRAQGKLNRTATAGHATDKYGGARLGYAFLHTALDDHSRLAYTEILADETEETATAFWRRAHAWFTGHGITITRVLSDNGSCYKSRLWADTCTQLDVSVKKTRPYGPRPTARSNDSTNHHRHHTAIGGPPATRVPNLSGQNT